MGWSFCKQGTYKHYRVLEDATSHQKTCRAVQHVTGSDSLQEALKLALHETMKTKPKWQWRPQNLVNTTNVGLLLTGNWRCWVAPVKDRATHARGGTAGGVELFKPIRAQIMPHEPPNDGHGAAGVSICPTVCVCCFNPFFAVAHYSLL